MSENKPKRRRRIPIIRRTAPAGTSPGTLAIDPAAPKPRLTVIAFGPDGHEEKELQTVAEIAGYRQAWPVVWLNVDGLGDHGILRQLADEFKLHLLALEDVVNIPQRAKLESYDEHLFIVARMIRLAEHLETEQVSIFVGDGYVLTFQEKVGDCFDAVRARIRVATGRIRKSGSDYLAYALLDTIIDGYYPVLEQYGHRIDALEEETMSSHDPNAGVRIHTIKHELLIVRRALSPHREALHLLLRDASTYVGDQTKVYLRDCYDHVVQLLDLVETYRELSSGLLDVHLAMVSNRMNEVMKVLTVFAAIFIPLSFIAGLYGMNFDPDSPWNMPELRWAFGYPLVLVLMAAVAGGLLLYFSRKGWIGSSRRKDRGAERR